MHTASRPSEQAPKSTELRLRRRKQRVIVRGPITSETSLMHQLNDRRACMPTLVGLGNREQLPTLFDEDTPLPLATRPRIHAICELDPMTNEQLLREAERLSQCFDWDGD